jgi:hypothetical protein
MIEWCFEGLGIGKFKFLCFSMNITDLVELNCAIGISMLRPRKFCDS